MEQRQQQQKLCRLFLGNWIGNFLWNLLTTCLVQRHMFGAWKLGKNWLFDVNRLEYSVPDARTQKCPRNQQLYRAKSTHEQHKSTHCVDIEASFMRIVGGKADAEWNSMVLLAVFASLWPLNWLPTVDIASIIDCFTRSYLLVSYRRTELGTQANRLIFGS